VVNIGGNNFEVNAPGHTYVTKSPPGSPYVVSVTVQHETAAPLTVNAATITVASAIGLIVSSGPNVEVFSPTLQLIESLQPFGSGVSSVQVARGNLNGDPDVIVASGSGGGEVKIYDSTTWNVVASYYPYTTGNLDGLFLAIGNVLDNNSQHQDVIVAPGGPLQNAPVEVYSGISTVPSTSFFPFPVQDPTHKYTGGLHLAAGNLNGSGQDSVIVGTAAPTAAMAQVWNYGIINNVAKMIQNGANYNFAGEGVYLATEPAGTHADLIVGSQVLTPATPATLEIMDGITGNVVTSLPTATLPVFSNKAAEEARVTVADVNQNGTLEIVVATGGGSTQQIRVFDLVGTTLLLQETLSASLLGLPINSNVGLFVA
jgi:hypothetical protein